MGNDKTQDYDNLTRRIYVIVFADQWAVHVNDSTVADGRDYYANHYRGRNQHTREAIAESKATGHPPQMYCVDTINGTRGETAEAKRAWIRYFAERGYTCLAGPAAAGEMARAAVENSAYYAGIKDIPLEMYVAAEKDLIRGYGADNKCKRTETSKIGKGMSRLSAVIPTMEYDACKRAAEAEGTSLTEFVRRRIRSDGTEGIDLTAVEAYFCDLRDCHSTLERIYSGYLLSRDYDPDTLSLLAAMCQEIQQSSDQIKRELTKLYRRLGELRRGKALSDGKEGAA